MTRPYQSATANADQEKLNRLIQAALENYPELTVTRLNQTAAFSRSSAAGDLPDPMLSLGLLNLPSGSLALDETPMSGIAIGLSQQIPWPGELRARSTLAGLAAETGVVMIVYLDEAVNRYRIEGRLKTPQQLKEAVSEGAVGTSAPQTNDGSDHYSGFAAGYAGARDRFRSHDADSRPDGRWFGFFDHTDPACCRGVVLHYSPEADYGLNRLNQFSFNSITL